jgi:hypothetical protein
MEGVPIGLGMKERQAVTREYKPRYQKAAKKQNLLYSMISPDSPVPLRRSSQFILSVSSGKRLLPFLFLKKPELPPPFSYFFIPSFSISYLILYRNLP